MSGRVCVRACEACDQPGAGDCLAAQQEELWSVGTSQGTGYVRRVERCACLRDFLLGLMGRLLVSCTLDAAAADTRPISLVLWHASPRRITPITEEEDSVTSDNSGARSVVLGGMSGVWGVESGGDCITWECYEMGNSDLNCARARHTVALSAATDDEACWP